MLKTAYALVVNQSNDMIEYLAFLLTFVGALAENCANVNRRK